MRVIVIEPSTGFGTGHHATTRLCLRALQEVGVQRKQVLDVGTGSGVLAIAAAKLGASSVSGVDNDPDAIAAARDNVNRNGVDVDLRVVDLEKTDLGRADVVLANLTGATLRRNAKTLASSARAGVLIVSGLLQEEEAAVAGAFAPYALRVQPALEDGWIALKIWISDRAIRDPSSAP
jgi:ribosomal protein L11 methyltransferase